MQSCSSVAVLHTRLQGSPMMGHRMLSLLDTGPFQKQKPLTRSLVTVCRTELPSTQKIIVFTRVGLECGQATLFGTHFTTAEE